VLTKVEVTNRRGNILTLAINEDEGDNPYQVSSIEGLEPVQATLTSSSYAGNDGEEFQFAKRGARNIIIKLDFDPGFVDDTYTSARQELYPFFTPKSEVKLRFYSDTGLYLDIVGIVEDFKSPLFEQQPTADISIMCYQPDFTDPRIIEVDGATVDDDDTIVLDYPGTVETGTVVTLNINRVVTDFTIYNIDEGGNILQLDFTGELEDGDTLVVSSRKGAKGITLTRAGVQSSYLYGRSSQSKWIELDEGLNNFRIYAPGDPIPYVLEYVVRYGGL
jgi:hypothetical protein